MQNPFIETVDKPDTKNLLHFHSEYSQKTSKQLITYHKDYYFHILPSLYLKNMYVSFFILFQNSLNSVCC
jgi:hypothetical protein